MEQNNYFERNNEADCDDKSTKEDISLLFSELRSYKHGLDIEIQNKIKYISDAEYVISTTTDPVVLNIWNKICDFYKDNYGDPMISDKNKFYDFLSIKNLYTKNKTFAQIVAS